MAADGKAYQGRRILFANGVTDRLPEIPGVADRWGRSIFHCPYCHGYELDQGRIGVLWTGPMSVHQAALLAEWGTVTYFTNGSGLPDQPVQQMLEGKGVTLDDTPITPIEGEADVCLSDGRVLGFAGLFIATEVAPSNTLAENPGCKIAEGPMGRMIAVDDAKQTTVAGVYACGDVARMPHSLSLAVGDGAMAGMHLHRSFVWPETNA